MEILCCYFSFFINVAFYRWEILSYRTSHFIRKERLILLAVLGSSLGFLCLLVEAKEDMKSNPTVRSEMLLSRTLFLNHDFFPLETTK